MSRIVAVSEQLLLVIEKQGRGVRILVNGQRDEVWEAFLADAVAAAPPMGVFYPAAGTLLAYYHALQHTELSRLFTEIRVEGQMERMPFQKGRIY